MDNDDERYLRILYFLIIIKSLNLDRLVSFTEKIHGLNDIIGNRNIPRW